MSPARSFQPSRKRGQGEDPGRGAEFVSAGERALGRLLEGESLEKSLPGFLRELRRILRFDWAALAFVDAEAPASLLPWRVGAAPEREIEACEGDWADLLAVASGPGEPAGRPVSDPLLLAALEAHGIRHAIRACLLSEGGEQVVLLLGREGGRPFEPDEMARVEHLWPALGAAARGSRRERLAEQVSRDRSAELSALLEVVRTAGRALDIDELFGGVAATLAPLMDLDLLAVLLETETRTSLTYHLARGLSAGVADELSALCQGAFEREAGHPAAGIDCRILHLPQFDPEDPPLERLPLLREILPLQRKGRFAGILAFVAERGRLTESMSRLLAAAAGQASLTVDRLASGAEAQARRLRSIIDSMSDGVILTDPEGRVETLNPAAQEHLRLLTGSGSPPSLGDLGGVAFAEIASGVLSGRPPGPPVEIHLAPGRRVLTLDVRPVAGRRGGVTGLVVVTSDVTEARALQEQMIQTEKLSSLGEMISGVAHELNNPLAAVMGYAQILQSSRVSAPVRRKLDIIDAEAQRCQNIVRNLLSFARKHKPERRPLSLNEVVQSVMGLLAYQLRVTGIETDISLDPSLPAVNGDFHQLQQVFMNIITNAHQALLEVTGPRKLMIRSREAGGWARVEIEDTGPGIPREILTRVFDPFFTTKEPGKGTGLGLSIVFGTVKAHDGRVSARSEPGGGAVFVVELPRARRVRAQRAGANVEMAPRPVPSRAILVVEDEEAVSSLMQEALAAEGHRVDAVPDGAEARRRLSRQDYDLIIADLRMPGEGGRELYEKVVSERPDMARRFVFATGDIASGEARAFFESTGRPCLEKPFDIATLQRVVRSLLETN